MFGEGGISATGAFKILAKSKSLRIFIYIYFEKHISRKEFTKYDKDYTKCRNEFTKYGNEITAN